MSKHRGHRVFNWIITTTKQPGGAPFIDKCIVRDNHDNHYRGRAFRLSLFKRDTPTFAFVIGKWEFNEIERLAQKMKQAFDSLAACLAEHEIERRSVTHHGKITVNGEEVGTITAIDMKVAPVMASHEIHPLGKASGIMETRANPSAQSKVETMGKCLMDDEERLAP